MVKKTTYEIIHRNISSLKKAQKLEKLYIQQYLIDGIKLINGRDNRGIEERKLRGYKITDTDYSRAMRRAKRSKTPLSTIIEEFVVRYGKKGFTTVEFLEYHPKNVDNQIK